MDIRNAFVVIADDSGATVGTIPPLKGETPTLARRQYDLLINHPYAYDLDGFNFAIHCQKNGWSDAECEAHRAEFFSKSHPCLRASPLTKTYGFGAHYNSAGKIAIYPVDSRAYGKLANDPANTVEMAMRGKRPGKASAKPAGAHPGRRPQSLHPHT